jgi:hypothetical protein
MARYRSATPLSDLPTKMIFFIAAARDTALLLSLLCLSYMEHSAIISFTPWPSGLSGCSGFDSGDSNIRLQGGGMSA